MTLTLSGLVVLILIAAVCGAVGKALAGGGQGGLVASVALGFIGALLGPWVARQLGLDRAPGASRERPAVSDRVVDHRRRAVRGASSPHVRTDAWSEADRGGDSGRPFV